jgi:hypothetical protein
MKTPWHQKPLKWHFFKGSELILSKVCSNMDSADILAKQIGAEYWGLTDEPLKQYISKISLTNKH